MENNNKKRKGIIIKLKDGDELKIKRTNNNKR